MQLILSTTNLLKYLDDQAHLENFAGCTIRILPCAFDTFRCGRAEPKTLITAQIIKQLEYTF